MMYWLSVRTYDELVCAAVVSLLPLDPTTRTRTRAIGIALAAGAAWSANSAAWRAGAALLGALFLVDLRRHRKPLQWHENPRCVLICPPFEVRVRARVARVTKWEEEGEVCSAAEAAEAADAA